MDEDGKHLDVYPFEKCRICFKVICPFNDEFIEGNIFMSAFRIFFVLKCGSDVNIVDDALSRKPPINSSYYIHIGSIFNVKKSYLKKDRKIYRGFSIMCWDMKKLIFYVDIGDYGQHDIKKTIKELLATDQYAAIFYPAYVMTQGQNTDCFGWEIYDLEYEFSRMTKTLLVDNLNSKNADSIPWRLTDMNSEYSMCKSYPSKFYVPKCVHDNDLSRIFSSRSKGRIPVLSWYNSVNNCSIVRASQPLLIKRVSDISFDMEYIKKIPNLKVIIDARPKINAIANMMNGGGSEISNFYSQFNVKYLSIPNIHVVRESYMKLFKIACDLDKIPDIDKIVVTIDWLRLIGIILEGAFLVVDYINEQNTSVLVHCSDGWDRTSQITALAMLILDPYYRTILGFQVLIEKEWCSMGHKFHERYGLMNYKNNPNQKCPVFIQFIECVWQLTIKHPSAFEFTEKMLIQILDMVVMCIYGNFLYNNEYERMQNQVFLKTLSMWSIINREPELYRNKNYELYHSVLKNETPFKPELWKEYYLRYSKMQK